MTGSWLKNLCVNVAIMLGSLIVFALLIELVIRGLQGVQALPVLTSESISVDGPPLQKHNAKLIKSKNPLLALEYDKSQPNINSFGMRDKEYTISRESNVIRIAAIGDSVTFGLGVPLEETYAKQLEKILNSQGDEERTYEVLNFGVSGYSTESELELYKATARQFKPDIVVVGYVMNDPIPTDSLFGVVSQSIRDARDFGQLARKSQLLAWIKLTWERALTAVTALNIYKPFYDVDSERWKSVKDSLQEFERFSREDGFQLVVVIFPMLYEFNDYPFSEFHQQVVDMLDELDIPYLDLLPEYRQYDHSDFKLLKNDATHPNERGHRIAAEKLKSYVLDQL